MDDLYFEIELMKIRRKRIDISKPLSDNDQLVIDSFETPNILEVN